MSSLITFPSYDLQSNWCEGFQRESYLLHSTLFAAQTDLLHSVSSYKINKCLSVKRETFNRSVMIRKSLHTYLNMLMVNELRMKNLSNQRF